VRGPGSEQNKSQQKDCDERDGNGRDPNNHVLPPRLSHFQ
jgi:hypothetical protein